MTAPLRLEIPLRGDNSGHAPALAALGAEFGGSPLMDDDYWASIPDPLPVRDLALLFKMSESSVFRRLQDGTIPAHYIGRSWIVYKGEVRAWLLTRRNVPLEMDFDPDPLADYPDAMPIPDLMAVFGKTKQTIRVWLKDGTIPAYKVNGRWIAYKAEIRQLLAQTSNQAAR